LKPSSYPFPLGRYTLLKQWKSDDWGIEFLARQEGLAGCSKLAFLKTLAKPVAIDPTFVELFLNEARIAARLSHPNIVQIYELNEVNGEYFIAMEYVHGHHLGTVLQAMQSKSLSFLPVLAAQLCIQILLGLRYAHMLEDEQGRPLNLVHKNLCPSNVLLGFNGAVKICNFGIPRTTPPEAKGGRALYVAPEQYVDGRIDARVDVYATGVLLAELLLGKIPRHCNNAQQLTTAISQLPSVSSTLADIVACALFLNRDERFESAREMALALEYYIEAADASQVTVELANFLQKLFGNNTSNPWLFYEMSLLEADEHLSQTPSEPNIPDESPLLPPLQQSKGKTRLPKYLAACLQCSPPPYLKWALASLLLVSTLCAIAWWLFHI